MIFPSENVPLLRCDTTNERENAKPRGSRRAIVGRTPRKTSLYFGSGVTPLMASVRPCANVGLFAACKRVCLWNFIRRKKYMRANKSKCGPNVRSFVRVIYTHRFQTNEKSSSVSLTRATHAGSTHTERYDDDDDDDDDDEGRRRRTTMIDFENTVYVAGMQGYIEAGRTRCDCLSFF